MTVTINLSNNTSYRIKQRGEYYYCYFKKRFMWPFFGWYRIEQYPKIQENTGRSLKVDYIYDHFSSIQDAIEWVKAYPDYKRYLFDILTQKSIIRSVITARQITSL